MVRLHMKASLRPIAEYAREVISGLKDLMWMSIGLEQRPHAVTIGWLLLDDYWTSELIFHHALIQCVLCIDPLKIVTWIKHQLLRQPTTNGWREIVLFGVVNRWWRHRDRVDLVLIVVLGQWWTQGFLYLTLLPRPLGCVLLRQFCLTQHILNCLNRWCIA